jgi:maltooligosyltrehalose trehalohydrolase
MPVAQCPGRWNWGYDGVDLFAPFNAYGRPDDLRRLVDVAHAVGLGVILDVVYNHLGPEGNYLSVFAESYFSDRHHTDWGAGLNWDGPDCEQVRQFAIDNACQWISEYHIDGLRLDATHAIVDDSPVHLVRELTERVREVAGEREVVVFAEDGRHEITRARPVAAGGEGLDGIWADDFHHEVRVHLTNAHENYYAAYQGATADIAASINDGFSRVTTGKKGVTPIGDQDPASAFVFCIQNHDQIGNRPFGDRLHHDINADRYAVASALLLFAPQTPLLFMGQEFAASTPFLYFTDHPEELGKLVTEGRRNEFKGFGIFDDPALRETIPDPQAESTFLSSKLNLLERWQNDGTYRLYQQLLGMRVSDPVLSHNDRSHTRASALTAEIVAVHRWWGTGHRLMLANFGNAIDLTVRDVDALTPVAWRPWHFMLATSQRRYGGNGNRPALQGFPPERTVSLPARSASIWMVGD